MSENAKPEPAKSAVSMKAVGIIVAVLVLQWGSLVGLYVFMGAPASVAADSGGHGGGHGADHGEGAAVIADDVPVEVLVCGEKFPNTRTGRTYVYDAEIYVVVQRKYQDRLEAQVKNMSAQISEDIREIVSRADRATLNEPTLATIKRQIKNRLDERFGRDEQGQSIIQQIVVKKFTEFMI